MKGLACLLLALVSCKQGVTRDELAIGSAAPELAGENYDGGSFRLSAHRGRTVVLFFGYTFCPDICPTTLVEMATILKELGEQSGRLQALFVTLDPERDSRQQLQTYTEFFDPRIVGLTGSPELVRRAAQNFKVRYAKVVLPGGDPANYAVDHAAGLILLGPDGAFVRKYPYGKPVAEIVGELRGLLAAR